MPPQAQNNYVGGGQTQAGPTGSLGTNSVENQQYTYSIPSEAVYSTSKLPQF